MGFSRGIDKYLLVSQGLAERLGDRLAHYQLGIALQTLGAQLAHYPLFGEYGIAGGMEAGEVRNQGLRLQQICRQRGYGYCER